MEQTKEMKDIENLKDDLKLCYRKIVEQKIRLMDRIGFSYRGKHYALVRQLAPIRNRGHVERSDS